MAPRRQPPPPPPQSEAVAIEQMHPQAQALDMQAQALDILQALQAEQEADAVLVYITLGDSPEEMARVRLIPTGGIRFA